MSEVSFFQKLNQEKAKDYVYEALKGADGGELFLEHCEDQMLSLDDRSLKNSSFSIRRGFGLRAFKGEEVNFSSSSQITEESLQKAVSIISSPQAGISKSPLSNGNNFIKHNLYSETNPILEEDLRGKVDLLYNIDQYIRGLDKRVEQVKISIHCQHQVVHIMRKDGVDISDVRPLVHFGISVFLLEKGKLEMGRAGFGGRASYRNFACRWKEAAENALRQAEVNLHAVEAPTGEMTVVLGPGWPGVLLHEAIGHGLEGDFNRKGISAFSQKMQQKVASECVTILDDGVIGGRRGSLNVDDEGNLGATNVLVKDGILVGYLMDEQNAKLMGVAPTGNGRRSGYNCQPMPRMTNTYMQSGSYTPAEIIDSVKDGIYALNFGGGQVDITSGKFVFSCSEGYLIKNGRITSPIKNATFIGDGMEVLSKISMAGNDLALDNGVGVCSKNGQDLPVGVGQPTLKIDSLTVGGTS